jgi:PAS domain S-box-containing protein
MKDRALSKRLSKGKKARSILISIRLQREDVEALDGIEHATDIRYDWIIRMLVKRFLGAWNRKKSIKAPIEIAVLNYGEAFTPLPISIASATSVRMIWKNNLAGENTFVNGNLLSFVGKTEEEMLGLKWMEIVHPDHREKLLAGWKKAAKLKLSFAYPFQCKRPDGTYTWTFSVSVPEFDSKGRLVAYNGSLFEVEPYMEKWIELIETDKPEV